MGVLTPVEAINGVKAIHATAGAFAATQQAAEYLAAHVINVSDYLYLVRWSEGRDKRTTAEWLSS